MAQQRGNAPLFEEVLMLVKFSTLANGVFIEVGDSDEYAAGARCFRFDDSGNAEYAILADLKSGNPAPRWFHHSFKESEFMFA